MDTFQLLMYGFRVALHPANLIFAFLGVVVGTIIGVLPGIGPISAVAILIPVTFGMNPTTAIIMMAGVYYGAMYGGSTTSILLNTPGESSSVVTTLDGYQLAKKGRAGTALGLAAIGSFVAGTLGVVIMMFLAPPLGRVAISFGPPEYFALMVLGLTTVTGFSEQSMVKGLISMTFGLMLATVGVDLQTGTARFTLGSPELLDGIDFLVVALGLFALAEVFWEVSQDNSQTEKIRLKGSVLPTWADLKASIGAMLRGSILGFFLGVLPGVGATTSSFLSYGMEKQISKHPEEFGKGALQGVAGPESANNGAATGALVPLLTLGLPGSGTTAVMLGALMMYGLRPGPLLIPNNPDLFWGLIASMYVGNVLLLILNLPLVGIFVKILDIPKPILMPMVVVFSYIGVYALSNSVYDLLMVLGFGVLGVLMRAARFPAPPLVLAVVLGPLLEQAMRQAMTISRGSPAIFVTRPISLAILILAALSLIYPPVAAWLRKRRAAPMAANSR